MTPSLCLLSAKFYSQLEYTLLKKYQNAMAKSDGQRRFFAQKQRKFIALFTSKKGALFFENDGMRRFYYDGHRRFLEKIKLLFFRKRDAMRHFIEEKIQKNSKKMTFSVVF